MRGRVAAEAAPTGSRPDFHGKLISLLRGQLETRFGSLPPDALARLEGADVDRLMAWGERVFDARTITEVFADANADRST